MAFDNAQSHFIINLAINLVMIVSKTSSSSPPSNDKNAFPIAKPNCVDRCGNIRIPYPFGTTPECYQTKNFWITCNQTFNPPKAFLLNTKIEITDLSLEGQLKVLQSIAKDCHNQDRTRVLDKKPYIQLGWYFTVNNTANKFTIVGCDTIAYVSGRRTNGNYQTGCIAKCNSRRDLTPGSCAGLGCCQLSIPKDVWTVEVDVNTNNYGSYASPFNNCSYAFLVEEKAFTFHPENLTNLRNVETLPMVVDWAIGNGNCKDAQKDASSYACKSVNSSCYEPDNGYGYRCSCDDGYQGNPYLVDGCQDIDECQDPSLNNCEKHCKNTPGGYKCYCTIGFHGDGIKDRRGCIRDNTLVNKLVPGITLGAMALFLVFGWLPLELKRRRQLKMRQRFFFQNGGEYLKEKISEGEIPADMVRTFGELELEYATNDFHSDKIIGRGSSGVVYKGSLPDNTKVAIKKSTEVDPKQMKQFINEVIVLSQINHRNVVKFLGCCLETQVPLFIYEFMDNGTLSEHIHDKAKASCLTWDMRLDIAIETAGVLSYLHFDASPPIIHRDVKSANILLDRSFTVKVSDFGVSKLIPLDQTHLITITMTQGTRGYLDPEYFQKEQFTQKSDVYSFGVVLVELLTGMKAWSYDRPEEDRNLANFFLSKLKQDSLFQILDDNVLREGNKEHIEKVVALAKSCLNLRGDDRPCMKDVAVELEGLRREEKHAWLQNEQDAEHMKSLLGEGYGDFKNDGKSNNTSIASDSLVDDTMLTSGR